MTGRAENVQWEITKEVMRSVLVAKAKRRCLITYSDLVDRVGPIRFGPRAKGLHTMLGEISSEEDAAGRGMLSVIVVRKTDNIPGRGFFELAESLGRDVSNIEKCWIKELRKVHGYWSKL